MLTVVTVGGVYCQRGNVSSLVSNTVVVAYIWKQSVGQPYLISESWANVDGLQKSNVL